MSTLRAAVVGFDITPRFHPTCGAWGTTPNMSELDLPLLARCVALEQGGTRVLWFGSDLVGEPVAGTDALRDEVAGALGLRREQVIWSTSQTHSSGAIPGSVMTGSSICDLSKQDPAFMAAERKRLMDAYVRAGREALERLGPARAWAGRGFCDTVSYNTRFPMPTGGVKFSRHHSEGLQSGKYFDPTVGLLRFDDDAGRPMGAIFNFCAHPATMINDKLISPDWVGSARAVIEEGMGGAPAMFAQGFCGDVNCHHLFGTAAQARRTGRRLGEAAVAALPTLAPVRGEPLGLAWQTTELRCRPMYTREELKRHIAAREAFVASLEDDPAAVWFDGINIPEQVSPRDKAAFVEVQMKYLRQGLAMLDRGESARSRLSITLGALRIGDAAAVLAPGENFTLTGRQIRERSPFAHTLICGDTNGLFGYIGTDDEIDRGGYETDSYWKMLYIDGFRLALAKGAAQRIVSTSLELLGRLREEAP